MENIEQIFGICFLTLIIISRLYIGMAEKLESAKRSIAVRNIPRRANGQIMRKIKYRVMGEEQLPIYL